MIIEAAFYKLSDYFQSIESPRELYESQLSFIFAVAIFQEFQQRGFSYLLPYIQVDRPYPNRSRKADIFVKLPKTKLPAEILRRWAASGVCEENWIEVKFFGGAERKDSQEPKTQNLGKVLEALLRLKFYVEEGGKYLLLVFSRPPEYYLPDREYLSDLLRDGENSIKVNLSEERKTVISSINDDDLRALVLEREVEFRLRTNSIRPIPVKGLLTPTEPKLLERRENSPPKDEPMYHFYLIRILEP